MRHEFFLLIFSMVRLKLTMWIMYISSWKIIVSIKFLVYIQLIIYLYIHFNVPYLDCSLEVFHHCHSDSILLALYMVRVVTINTYFFMCYWNIHIKISVGGFCTSNIAMVHSIMVNPRTWKTTISSITFKSLLEDEVQELF